MISLGRSAESEELGPNAPHALKWDRGDGGMNKRVILVALVAAGIRSLTSLSQIAFGIHAIPGTNAPLMWTDFYAIYVPQLRLLATGVLPYSGFGYSYPPLFLYSMLPFYQLGGAPAAGVPIVIADALTSPLIYLLVAERVDEHFALLAAIAYALSPLALVNEGYLWLGDQPAVFFAILSLYYFEKDKPVLSMAVLAIAVMFKQELTAMVIPLVILIGLKERRASMIGLVTFMGIVGAISVPFLVISPGNYLAYVSYGIVSFGRFIATINASTLRFNSLASFNCFQTTFAGLFTGAICGSSVNSNQLHSNLLNANLNQLYWNLVTLKINSFFTFITPVLYLLTCVSLYAVRKSASIPSLLSALSVLGLLLAFSNLVHSALAYYFLPVYALVIAGSIDVRTLATAFAGSVASTFLPEGSVQAFVAVLTILIIVVETDSRINLPDRPVDVLGSAQEPRNGGLAHIRNPRMLFISGRTCGLCKAREIGWPKPGAERV
jgi:hypothetical protein